MSAKLTKQNNLLVCICHHFDIKKLSILKQTILNYFSYDINTSIVIDTNDRQLLNYIKETPSLTIKIHEQLNHPYDLAGMHRQTMSLLKDDYDYFMYAEDDMVLPFKNFIEYFNNFYDLYKINAVPSFIRIETCNGIEYVLDVIEQQKNRPIIKINGKTFINLTHPYHAFWILPQKELKQSLTPKFVEQYCIGDANREFMASYVMWTLNKTPYVLVENNEISKLSYSYHISNTYINSNSNIYSKYHPSQILI